MNIKTMSYDELSEHVTEAIAELKRKAYGEGYEQGKFDQRMETAFEKVGRLVNEETPQEKRDRIVERAKDDIEKLKGGYDNIYNVHPYTCYAEFIINKDKRTVVVLLRGITSTKIRAKGIAKCAPSDCFNVYIGKAIALHRALGLEVPDEYLNAPQPTEVRVGDIVRWGHLPIEYKVASTNNIFGNIIGTNEDGEEFEACGSEFKYARIIDDSHEEVSE